MLRAFESSIFLNPGQSIIATEDTEWLEIKCPDTDPKRVSFTVIKGECNSINQNIDDETEEIFLSEGYSEEQIDTAKRTENFISHDLDYGYVGDDTVMSP